VALLISPELVNRNCGLESIGDTDHWIFPLNLVRVFSPACLYSSRSWALLTKT
jgi:hypothetical protein